VPPADSIRHLFVYGTLRPGDVRWKLLAPFAADDGVDDTAAGHLFDTGLDYPAALFDGDGTIVGRTYRLRDDRMAEALDVLDEEEDTVRGLYRRIAIVTGRGVHAWAYQYGTGLTLTPIESGDWFRRRDDGRRRRGDRSPELGDDRERGRDVGVDLGGRERRPELDGETDPLVGEDGA
jgi:gamma-glutamylcyclotransferase (GGCT)/AIG2-like uncharacterized protein YtfP